MFTFREEKAQEMQFMLEADGGKFLLGGRSLQSHVRCAYLTLGSSTVHRRVVVNHCLFPGGLGVFSDNLDPAH